MQNDLIFDVGMNNGDDTAYYLHCGYRVVAIEADPTLCASAATRFADAIRNQKLKILNVAISEKAESGQFWICETHSEWSSFNRSNASRDGAPHHAITVQGCNFADLLDEHGVPFYLKVDIEGNDWLCVEGLRGKELPRYLSIEQGASKIKHLDVLQEVGFVGFKCIGQQYFLPLQNPISDEEREYSKFIKRVSGVTLGSRVLRRLGFGGELDNRKIAELRCVDGWQFPTGSSGPFGEGTRGRWLDYAEFKSTVLRSNAAFAAGEPSIFWGAKGYSFWADFHMRSSLYSQLVVPLVA